MGDDPGHYSRFATGDKLMSLWNEHDPQGKIKVTKSLHTGFQQTGDGVCCRQRQTYAKDFRGTGLNGKRQLSKGILAPSPPPAMVLGKGQPCASSCPLYEPKYARSHLAARFMLNPEYIL
jgi:hypothetical protein